MKFIRKRKRGQNKKVQRSWYSDEGYRIVWRKQVHGVTVPARYSACVRSFVPNYGGKKGENHEIWDFVDRRLFKTMKTAEAACAKHHRLWTKACDASGVRGLQELFGRLPTSLPLWVQKKMNRKALAVLMAPRNCKFVDEDEACDMTPAGCEPNPSDPIATSTITASPSIGIADISTPVSPATAEVKSTTRKTRRARSKATVTEEPSPAKPATARAKVRAKRASKRTAKSSASGKRKSKSTSASSKPARKPSKGSRTKKSKPSAN